MKHDISGGRMTEDELNSLIAHAHRRIDQLQKQLAEQQVTTNVIVPTCPRCKKLTSLGKTVNKEFCIFLKSFLEHTSATENFWWTKSVVEILVSLPLQNSGTTVQHIALEHQSPYIHCLVTSH